MKWYSGIQRKETCFGVEKSEFAKEVGLELALERYQELVKLHETEGILQSRVLQRVAP